MSARQLARAPIHAVGALCLLFAAMIFIFERWSSLVSLRPAQVVGLNPAEKEMSPLLVTDRSGRRVAVSADWRRVERLSAGETVWIRDTDDRYGDCTSACTVLEDPFFLTEAVLTGALLYLGWLVFLARRRWNRSKASPRR